MQHSCRVTAFYNGSWSTTDDQAEKPWSLIVLGPTSRDHRLGYNPLYARNNQRKVMTQP